MSKFRNYDNYEIYADGRIYSYIRKKFLKPHTNKNGYQIVHLTDNNGNKKWYLLHRVVYETFSGEQIPECMQVNHRNEIKTDNRFFENLELVTPKQNCNFGTRNSRISKGKINGKTSKRVGAFKNDELVMVFKSTNEAGRNGFDQGNVAKCCRNCYLREGNNVFKGFEWRYI